MAMLPEHLKGRQIHFCQPEDDYDEEEEEELDPEYDQMKKPEDPVNKRAKLESAQPVKREPLRLTKHLKEVRKFAPAYTGGAIQVLKDEKHSLAMNDQKLCLFDVRTAQVISSLVHESEEISTFAISPNQ